MSLFLSSQIESKINKSIEQCRGTTTGRWDSRGIEASHARSMDEWLRRLGETLIRGQGWLADGS
jgi:hypothetical protein